MYQRLILTVVLMLNGRALASGKPVTVIPRARLAPAIDGKLDDPAWEAAAIYLNFTSVKPDFGRAASERTRFYLTYDSQAVCAAFECSDSDPGGIKATMSRRDSAVACLKAVRQSECLQERQSSLPEPPGIIILKAIEADQARALSGLMSAGGTSGPQAHDSRSRPTRVLSPSTSLSRAPAPELESTGS